MPRSPRSPRQRAITGRRAGALLVLAVLAPRALDAQRVVQLVPGAGGVGVEYGRNGFGYAGGATSRVGELRGWLQIPLQGTIGSARFLTYRLTLRPTLQRVAQDGYADALDARQLNLSYGLTFFGAQPLSLSVAGSRASGGDDGAFGRRRAFTATSRSATLWFRPSVLPMRLTYERQTSDETWTVVPDSVPTTFANEYRVVRFSANTSKLNFLAQRVAYDDRVAAFGYVSWTAQAQHVFRWGRGSRLESGYEYLRQTGSLGAERRDWRERLHLNHGRRVGTDYHYRQASVGAGPDASSTRAFGAGVTVTAARWLHGGIGATRSVARRGTVREGITAVTPRLGVRVRLPLRATLSGTGSVGYEWRRPSGTEGPVPVVDEAVVVPPTRVVTLEQPDVESGSVVVRSVEGTVVYAEGVDYEVRPVGRFTDLLILPGSRIGDGATVLVSYRYMPPTTAPSDAVRTEVGLSLDAGPVRLSHTRGIRSTRRDAGPVEGPDPSLADFDDRRTGLRVQLGLPLGRMELDAAHRRRDRVGTRTTDYQLDAQLRPPPLGPVDLTVGASWTRTHQDSARVESRSLHASAAWAVFRRLEVRVRGELLAWSQAGAEPRRTAAGTADARWQFGATDVTVRYDRLRDAYLGARHHSRLIVQASRRF